MMIGVRAIIVEAIPASVYFTAINDKDTPMNGPEMVVPIAANIPFLSFKEVGIVWNSFCKYMTKRKQMAPDKALIHVEAKGTSE